MCEAGLCTGCAADADCDDGEPCTDDRCDDAVCVQVPNTAACDDGDACTFADACAGGACAGTAVVCQDDPGPCGANRACNGTAACTVTYPGSGTGCNDGNACTVGDHCNGGGACVGGGAATNGTGCGAAASRRCCGGTCVDTSADASNCGGCGIVCGAGLACEDPGVTTGCGTADSSGRCRCTGANAQCPGSQICRTFTPWNNRCAPVDAGSCAPGQHVVALSSCPDLCSY
ncbi:MAG: hypothetical protein H6745_25120 [Deltaproteobacteria bacterium]|nr:hypothetical protein [Deltaproteobacteria bacterium]